MSEIPQEARPGDAASPRLVTPKLLRAWDLPEPTGAKASRGQVTVVGGAIAGLVWKLVVPLTTYAVNSDGGAVTSERGLANYVAGDVWFTGLGLVLGLALGLLVWRWFAGVGWPVVVIAVFGATVMALSCWQTGWWLGPGAFEPRLANASPGDVLPIELTVRAPAAVLVWPFGAVLPIMLLSSLLRDPEESGVRPPMSSGTRGCTACGSTTKPEKSK